jgi:SNF2 family DNA or RNA helicase
MAHATIDPVTGEILLATVWNEKQLAEAIPGSRWDARNSTWRLVSAWASLVTARGLFGQQLTLGQDVIDWAWKIRDERIDTAMRKRSEIDPDPGDDTPLLEGLYPFQAAGVQFMHVAQSGLLGDEMGTGKTVQVMGLLHAVSTFEEALPALVICPSGVRSHWRRHVPRWFPAATPYVVDGTAAKRRKVLKAALADPTAIVFIGIEAVRLFTRLAPYGSVRLKRCRTCDPKYGDEGLSTARCEVHHKELNDFEFRTVVLDEAHRVKNPQALQTRAVWHVMHSPSVTRRWGLTGTPIASHPGDLWSIMHGIAPDDFPTRGDYLNRFCLGQTTAFGNMEFVGIRPDTREELFKILDPRFRRMLKAVVLSQLPPRTRVTRRTQLTPQMRRVYEELKEDLRTTVDGGLFVAPNHLVKNVRLMQFACASVYVDRVDPDKVSTWIVTLREPSPKLDELEVVLEELGVLSPGYSRPPVLVAAQFKQLLRMAAKRLEKLGVAHAVIDGDVSQHDRDRALDALNAGQIKVLLFTGQSGGTGLDMSAADVLINLQRSWSMIDERQKEDRNHRIGSEHHESVLVIDILTEDSVEESQVDALLEKMLRLDEITRDRAELARANLDTSALDAEEARILRTDLFAVIDEATRETE